MKFRIEITPQALADTIEIQADLTDAASAEIAERVLHLIELAIESLTDFPKRFILAPEGKTHHVEIRHMFVGNHRVIYRIIDNVVWVLRGRHTSQRDLSPGELN